MLVRHLIPLVLVLPACDFAIAPVDAPMSPDAGQLAPLDAALATPPDLATPDLAPVDPCVPTLALPQGDLTAGCAIGAPPAIDGDLSDWPSALFVPLRHESAAEVSGAWAAGEAQNDVNLSSQIAARWDSYALYLALRVSDDKRGTFGTFFWDDDAAELYLDGQYDRSDDYGDDDYELIVQPGGSARRYQKGNEIAMPAGVSWKTSDGPGGAWSAEVAIPWALLGPESAWPGRTVGFTLQLDDNDGGIARDRTLLWKNTSPAACTPCGATCEPWCDTRTFGALVLGGR